ncbi:MAG: LytTR family DNA-binding domain-containing protein [Bacteroidota bacterium]
MKSKINYLIVDDEALARDSIKILLKGDSDLNFVGECANGKEALDLLKNHTIDLIWLDIQMPDWNGFEVLERMNFEQLPYVVFVTAYDEFALKAFEYNAVDYLLKPFSNERFYKALRKAKEVISKTVDKELPIRELIRAYRNQTSYRKRFSVREKDRILLLEVRDIDWIKASDGYLEVGAQQKKYLIQESLKNLEGQLNPEEFVRIHRSTIVNLSSIRALEPYFNGEYHVILKNQERFKLSRNYKDKLATILDDR